MKPALLLLLWCSPLLFVPPGWPSWLAIWWSVQGLVPVLGMRWQERKNARRATA